MKLTAFRLHHTNLTRIIKAKKSSIKATVWPEAQTKSARTVELSILKIASPQKVVALHIKSVNHSYYFGTNRTTMLTFTSVVV